MTRLFVNLRTVILIAAIPLAACAAAPPSGPTVRAMPRSGESVNQFQADDLACRNYVQTRTAPPGAVQEAAKQVKTAEAPFDGRESSQTVFGRVASWFNSRERFGVVPYR